MALPGPHNPTIQGEQLGQDMSYTQASDESRAAVSAIVITRNEAANLEACLESLGWVQEIVVVDAESDDGTLEVARRLAHVVVSRPWSGYKDQLNHAAGLARNDWILRIDADERVTPDLADEIGWVINSKEMVAYKLGIREYMFGAWIDHGGWDGRNYRRLYRRSKCRWQGEVHETLAVDGDVGGLRGQLEHYSHLSVSHFIKKMDRYTEIEARERVKSGETGHLIRVAPIVAKTILGRWLLRGGFRDGGHGFVIACLLAMYYAAREFKTWEMSRFNGQEGRPQVPTL